MWVFSSASSSSTLLLFHSLYFTLYYSAYINVYLHRSWNVVHTHTSKEPYKPGVLYYDFIMYSTVCIWKIKVFIVRAGSLVPTTILAFHCSRYPLVFFFLNIIIIPSLSISRLYIYICLKRFIPMQAQLYRFMYFTYLYGCVFVTMTAIKLQLTPFQCSLVTT